MLSWTFFCKAMNHSSNQNCWRWIIGSWEIDGKIHVRGTKEGGMFWRPNENVVLLVMIGNFKSGTKNFKGGIGNFRGNTKNFKDEKLFRRQDEGNFGKGGSNAFNSMNMSRHNNQD